MKFYRVTYREPSTGDGYAREYFTTKRDAVKRLNAVRQEIVQDAFEEFEKRAEPGDKLNHQQIRDRSLAACEMDELEFSGTAKEMVLAALRSGI